jgi:hypothetical protein
VESSVCRLSTEVKPQTISRRNQKTDTTAQPEKKFLQLTRSECIILQGNIRDGVQNDPKGLI